MGLCGQVNGSLGEGIWKDVRPSVECADGSHFLLLLPRFHHDRREFLNIRRLLDSAIELDIPEIVVDGRLRFQPQQLEGLLYQWRTRGGLGAQLHWAEDALGHRMDMASFESDKE